MLKDKIYPASCLLPLEYTEPCAWKSLKFPCPGGWVGHKKNCSNTPFAGINSVLSKATMLIPSKSPWSIKKPLSLRTYGVGRIRKTKELQSVSCCPLHQTWANSCSLLTPIWIQRLSAKAYPGLYSLISTPATTWMKHTSSEEPAKAPLYFTSAAMLTIPVALYHPSTLYLPSLYTLLAFRGSLQENSWWLLLKCVWVSKPGYSEMVISQTSMEEMGSFTWVLRILPS